MLLSLLVIVSLVGCDVTEFDTDRIVDDIDVSTGIAIPLVKSSITMGDILSDDTDQVKYYTDEDGNERIMFYQYEDSVEHVGLDDFFRVSVDAVDVPVPFVVFNAEPQIEAAIEIPFSVPDATIKKLELSYELSVTGTNLAAPLLVTFNFPSANIGSGGKEIAFEVYNNQTAVQTSTKDMFEIEMNKLPASISIQPLDGSSGFGATVGNVSIGMSNMAISYVKGSMAENAIELDEGIYDLDFDVLEDVPGDVEFSDPKLSILLNNATPFQGVIAADLKGEVEDQPYVNLNAPFIQLPACPLDQNSIAYSYNLDKTNSNLIEFVSKKPTNLTYAGHLVLNPDGVNSNDVELYEDDKIYIGYGVEIPLDLKLSGTIDIDPIELDDLEMIDDLSKATLVFTSDNGFPFEAKAILEFFDDDVDAVIETIEVDIIKGAKVDPLTGIVTEKVANVVDVVLTDTQIEKLNQSEELRVSVLLQTTNYDDGQSVVLLKNNELDLQLSIKGKIDQN